MPSPLRFKVDENLPTEAADYLRQAGYDATTVAEEQLSGAPDALIATVCQQKRRALLTLDMDFADIRAYAPGAYAGLVVLRLNRQDKGYVLETIRRLIGLLARETLEGYLWIVEEQRIRIRG